MIRSSGLNVSDLRSALEGFGDSLIVVGDASATRVHIHTHNTVKVIQAACSFGSLSDIDIRNMDEQHQDFLLANRGRTSNLSTGVVAVVNGDGMVNVFADLGVAAVVLGGHTMNPSTTEILKTVENVSSNNIIVLPNNKNVIPATLLVQTLTKKNVRVIPTETIPQGISAVVSFLPEADFETNLAEMTAAMSTVRTIEATRATRATRVNNLEIR